MSNMSYCRFHNTLQDLMDCADHIADNDLSDDENRARKRLIKLAYQIAMDFVNDDLELDEEAIEELQPKEDAK